MEAGSTATFTTPAQLTVADYRCRTLAVATVEITGDTTLTAQARD